MNQDTSSKAKPQNAALDAAIDWLALHQGGQPSQRQHVEFLRWLNNSDEHRRAYDKAKMLWLSTEIEQAGLRLDVPIHATTKKRAFKHSKWLSLATAAVVAITVGISQQLLGQAQYHTASGERQDITLSDGSLITLNTRTEIDTHFTADQRLVELHQGEAYFQVARDENRPFIVTSGDSQVSVLGTSFNVRAESGDISVSVFEGLVTIAREGLDKQQLAGGDWAQTSKEQIEVSRVAVGPANFGWLEGRLIIHDQNMAAVVNEIRRYVPGVIMLLGEEQPQQTVSGNFSLNDPVHALETLAQLNHYQVIRLTDYLLIVRPIF